MKIAIDTRALAAVRTGGGNYAYYLLDALSRIDRKNEYLLCAHREAVGAVPALGENFRFKINKYPSGSLWQQVCLPRLLVREKVSLFHSLLFTAPLCVRCPTIITVFDLSPLLFPGWHNWKVYLSIKAFLGASVRNAARIIAISESTKRDIVSVFKVKPEKVRVIPLAAGKRFSLRGKDEPEVKKICRKYAGDNRFILSVGTLEPRKNLEFLICAYKSLLRQNLRNSPLLLLAGGKGWKYSNIFKRVESEGLKEKVVFTGYVPDSELPELYNGASLFVFPSLYEGFGIPLLEAMSSGVPVIAGRHSSIPEVVGDGGKLMDGWDADEWALEMKRLLESRELSERMSTAALAQAQKFSWEKCARETLEVYES